MIGLFCLLVASASFQGYYSRWGMHEDVKFLGLQLMFNGQAPRPWAYRILLPAVADAVTDAIPPPMRKELTAKLQKQARRLHYTMSATDPPLALQADYAIRYYLIYYMAFMALVIATPIMMAVCRQYGVSPMASITGSAFFLLLFPILEDISGYYYDTTEILCMFTYVLLITQKRLRIACIPLTVLATFNKESFLFFIITTVPLCLTFRRGVHAWARDRAGLVVTALCATIAAAIHLAMIPAFADRPGSETIFWLGSNVRFYANPLSLFQSRDVYGVRLFAGYSIITLVLLTGVMRIGLPRLDTRVSAYAAWAALINLPLFILFGLHGEVRNLSFLYPPALFAMSAALDRLLSSDGATASVAQPHSL